MKQLKSYFQRVDDLKSQLKNMSVMELSPQQPKNQHHLPQQKQRATSRDKPKLQKQNSFNVTKKGDTSLSKLYSVPKKEKSSSRYKPRSTSSDSKQPSTGSKSQSHFTSTDYEKLKMSYLKSIVKRPAEISSRANRDDIKKLINSIKCRDERSSSRQRDKEYKSNTVSVQKNGRTTSTTNMFHSLQVDLQTTPLKLSYSYRTRQGVLITNPKKVNQDSLLIKTKMLNSNTHLFAVADGHGIYGHQISQLVAKNLSKYLENFIRSLNVEEAFQLSYLKLQQLISDSSINSSCSGTTLVSILLRNNELICANAGDSRAILGRRNTEGKKWELIELSRDHKPSLPDERDRIMKMGGRIDTFKDEKGNPLGPERVWLPNQKIQGLAMSRSLGDNVSKDIGVTCQPQIFRMKIQERDKFILLASDGVWQFISNEQILDLIVPYSRDGRLEQACDALMKLAYQRWTVEDESVIDDITLILIFLNI